MKRHVVQSHQHKLGIELGALGVNTALTHKAGADTSAKRKMRNARKAASSPCIVRDASGNITRIITRTKTERDIVKRHVPQIEVKHQMTYNERMSKYGVIGNVE